MWMRPPQGRLGPSLMRRDSRTIGDHSTGGYKAETAWRWIGLERHLEKRDSTEDGPLDGAPGNERLAPRVRGRQLGLWLLWTSALQRRVPASAHRCCAPRCRKADRNDRGRRSRPSDFRPDERYSPKHTVYSLSPAPGIFPCRVPDPHHTIGCVEIIKIEHELKDDGRGSGYRVLRPPVFESVPVAGMRREPSPWLPTSRS